MKKSLKIGLIALLVIIAGLATRHFLFNPGSKLSTQALFTASFPDADGKPQAFSQWQGKVAVVNFWASWCGPCREEMPELSQLQDEYSKQGLIVLGISTEDVDDVRAFKKEVTVSYPLLAADLAGAKLAEYLGNNRGILPYTVILDAEGNVTKTYFGRINKALLEETLKPLLSSKPKPL